ncbi:MAG TPA: hypothetical protein PLC08_06225 [Candidatus Bipolaricaulis sp.]|nr:hypothetical protein [Candidatus Bipolaricaulis sp.]
MMPQIQRGYRPEAEGDELRIAGVAARYPLCALVADVLHTDTEVELGYIPQGAIVVGAIVDLVAQFDAGDAATIDVGYGASLNEIVAAFDAQSGVVGTYLLGANGLAAQEEDKLVKAQVTQTGTASTAGEARITVLYAIPYVAWPAETEPLDILDPDKGKDGTHTIDER